MSAGAAAPERRPRLNPFAFPSDTAFRFGLLVTAVIGANLYVWEWIATVFADKPRVVVRRGGLPVRSEPRQLTTPKPIRVRRTGLSLPGVVDARRNRRPAARGRRDHARAPALDHSPATLAATDARGRAGGARRGPRAGERAGDPRAATSLEPARCVAGRTRFRPPRPLLGRARREASSSSRRPTRPAFRAILRHELAHIRNRDVGITYFTIAIWYAFLLVAVLPFALTLLDEGVGSIFSVTWRLLVLAALVYLTRNAVLRSREVYADVRASVSDGPDGALRRVLAELPRPAAGLLGTRAARAPRPESPARGSRRHPAALPARRRRRIRSRPLRQRSRTTASSRSCPRSSPTRSTCASRPHWRTRRSSWASSASRSGVRRSRPSPTGASPPRRGSTAWRLPPVS